MWEEDEKARCMAQSDAVFATKRPGAVSKPTTRTHDKHALFLAFCLWLASRLRRNMNSSSRGGSELPTLPGLELRREVWFSVWEPDVTLTKKLFVDC